MLLGGGNTAQPLGGASTVLLRLLLLHAEEKRTGSLSTPLALARSACVHHGDHSYIIPATCSDGQTRCLKFIKIILIL